MSDWNPAAKRVPGIDAGAFTGGQPKVVLHTTEGSSASGAIAAFMATGSWPHFTISPTELYQHLPISRAARALEHPAGTCETNRDNCVQIEMVGFAKDTQNWPAAYLSRISKLCRWIEQNHKMPSTTSVRFTATPNLGAKRLTCAQWHSASGYVGHEHVPNNSHWDPGRFPIAKILSATPATDSGKVERWRDRLRYTQALLRVTTIPASLRTQLQKYAEELRALIRKNT